jgi:hypothetical protein
MENAREVESARLPVIYSLARLEQIGAADQIAEGRMPSLAINCASSATRT